MNSGLGSHYFAEMGIFWWECFRSNTLGESHHGAKQEWEILNALGTSPWSAYDIRWYTIYTMKSLGLKMRRWMACTLQTVRHFHELDRLDHVKTPPKLFDTNWGRRFRLLDPSFRLHLHRLICWTWTCPSVPHCGNDYELISKNPGGASHHAGITRKHMMLHCCVGTGEPTTEGLWCPGLWILIQFGPLLPYHLGFAKLDFLIAPKIWATH